MYIINTTLDFKNIIEVINMNQTLFWRISDVSSENYKTFLKHDEIYNVI